MKIARIELQYRYDTDPDYSHLGEYTDEVSPGVIDRSTGEFLRWEFGEPVNVPARGREYRFFKPCAGGEKPGTKNYYKYGRHDYARIVGLEREDWQYIGIMAAATVLYEMANGLRRLETFTSGGLWGVESDCAEHCKAMANEEIEDLREHLSQFGITVSDQDWQTLTEDLDPVWKYT